MKYGDLTLGQIEAVVNKLGGMDAVKGILQGSMVVVAKATHITQTFTVLVDETQTVEKAVEAGKFLWVDSNITSDNFFNTHNGEKRKKEIFIFHFNKWMSSDEVIAEMDSVGYKPATIFDLLGLAKEKPDFQREFQIVALGSIAVFKGHGSYAPTIQGGPCFRELTVSKYNLGNLGGNLRYAGVCK
jgi:hypothetical protein